MADPTPLSDDELVSAYIDGELTADERARVEADPDLMTLLHELTPVVTAARTPVRPLAPDVLDDLIGRALDAGLASEPMAAGPAERVAPVIDLSERRARRNQLLARVGAVAAGVAVIAIAGAVLQNGIGGSDSDTATDASSAIEDRDLMADADADADAEISGADAEAEMAPPEAARDEAASEAAETTESAGSADEGATADEDDGGLVGFAPPQVPGLPTQLGSTDLAGVELLVDENLQLFQQTPPVGATPRCADLGLLEDGFELVWWAEAVFEGSVAHVVAWRSPTELLFTVYPGPGGLEAETEECPVIQAFAR